MRNVPIVLVILLACASAGGAEPASPVAALEKSLREAMLLPPDTRLVYRDENGAPMTAEQFAQRMQVGAGFDMKRDEAAGTATVMLKPKATPESEIGPVTQLPPLDLKDLYGRRIRNLDLAAAAPR